MKLEAGAQIGPYKILGELGQGGMATVYRAYQPALEREVALKVLPEFLIEEPGFKTRFHREAVAVARLQHPNILSVFDHGEQNGVTYIVSEYVEGGTLAARLGAPIQLDYCVRILRPIADALDYAHSEGVVHRDVKPSNILLDRRGVPILSDFGLARMAETRDSDRLTQTGAAVGTPTYMSPEQCAGEEVGAPSDIYALAVIAYEMVTGRVPFSAPTPLAVMSAHQLKPPPMPRKLNPSLPAAVEAPLLAGLAKDPADRPATATEFIDALSQAVSSSVSPMPMTPAPIFPMSPPPPSQVPVPAPSPAPPSVSWPPLTPPVSSSNPIAPPSQPPVSSPPPPMYSPPTPLPPPMYSPPTPLPPALYPPPASYQPPQAPYSYQAPPAWAGSPPARRAGLASWVYVVLWVGVAVGVLGVIWSIVQSLVATGMSTTERSTFLALGIVSAVAAAAALAALLGLRARDSWGPTAAWVSVIAFALSVLGAPLAAAVGWGLAQAPRNQLVSNERRPGGGLRAGGAALAGALMLVLVGSTAAWGWTHSTGGGGSISKASPMPTGCAIAQPGSPTTANAVGGLCGFKLGARLVGLDCKAATALPAEIHPLSVDPDNVQGKGGATFRMDSAGCHFASPGYQVDSRLQSVDQLPPGDTMFLADFVPPATGILSVGFAIGCDGTSCVYVEYYLPNNLVRIYDGTTQVVSREVPHIVGTNRMLVTFRQRQIVLWLNGVSVTTETLPRTHGAGTYSLYVDCYEKGKTIAMDVFQYAVYRLS